MCKVFSKNSRIASTSLLIALAILTGGSESQSHAEPDLNKPNPLVAVTEGEASPPATSLHPSHVDASRSSQPKHAVQLNNEGVDAINSHNFRLAIDKLTQALGESPYYVVARQNLSFAHSGYGSTLRSEPKKALAEFHKAMLLDLASDSKRYDVDCAIRRLGHNPGSYKDRLALSNAAANMRD